MQIVSLSFAATTPEPALYDQIDVVRRHAGVELRFIAEIDNLAVRCWIQRPALPRYARFWVAALTEMAAAPAGPLQSVYLEYLWPRTGQPFPGTCRVTAEADGLVRVAAIAEDGGEHAGVFRLDPREVLRARCAVNALDEPWHHSEVSGATGRLLQVEEASAVPRRAYCRRSAWKDGVPEPAPASAPPAPPPLPDEEPEVRFVESLSVEAIPRTFVARLTFSSVEGDLICLVPSWTFEVWRLALDPIVTGAPVEPVGFGGLVGKGPVWARGGEATCRFVDPWWWRPGGVLSVVRDVDGERQILVLAAELALEAGCALGAADVRPRRGENPLERWCVERSPGPTVLGP